MHSNFPIIRSMNKHEISNYLAKLGNYDEFLLNKDLNSLTEAELKLACTERYGFLIFRKNDIIIYSNFDISGWCRC